MEKRNALTVAVVVSLALLAAMCGAAPAGAAPPADKDQVKLRVFVHYPGHGGKGNVSYCSLTQDDQVNDYGLTGWQLPAAGFTYWINYRSAPANLTEAQIYQAMSAASATWTAAAPSATFYYGGATTAKPSRYDGVNAVGWGKLGARVLAVAYSWYSGGVLIEGDIVFNLKYKWSLTDPAAGDCGGTLGYDVGNIATHELGHWVGLDDLYHAADQDLTMYGYSDLNELKKDSLGLGDVTGAAAAAP